MIELVFEKKQVLLVLNNMMFLRVVNKWDISD